MLGDKVYQGSGKVTARRILDGNGHGPRVETTIEELGSLLGVDMTETVTYWAEMQPDGHLYGEGRGIVMGKGSEAASFKGSGVGRMAEDGSVSFRGTLYFQSASPAWAKLNGAAVIFEHDVDPQGKTRGQSWEWR